MNPVFIHSLHRSGSTWLFKAFRRAEGIYWCYAEPEHQIIKILLESDTLLSIGQETANQLRHQTLELPYFWEIDQVKECLRPFVSTEIAYKNYFCDTVLNATDAAYFERLISCARRRPVLQLCRSSGRAHALKMAFKGIHIHLWREPIAQWWSMKVDPYFDDAVCLIYGLKSLPTVLRTVRGEIEIPELDYTNPIASVERVRELNLNAEQRYRLFFGLWVFSFLSVSKIADLEFAIDRVSLDDAFKERTIRDFERFGLQGLSFQDCRIPGIRLTQEEISWYRGIECVVKESFVSAGYGSEYDRACASAEIARKLHIESCDVLVDAKRQRELVLQMEERFSAIYRLWYLSSRFASEGHKVA